MEQVLGPSGCEEGAGTPQRAAWGPQSIEIVPQQKLQEWGNPSGSRTPACGLVVIKLWGNFMLKNASGAKITFVFSVW